MTQQADENMDAYEAAKAAIYRKKSTNRRKQTPLDDFDDDLGADNPRRVTLTDVIQVGNRVVIGSGVGLLAGVATIAVAASAAEVVVAGVVTKIAGVVGGAMGLSMGLSKYSKKKRT
jgi:hypothetical protein